MAGLKDHIRFSLRGWALAAMVLLTGGATAFASGPPGAHPPDRRAGAWTLVWSDDFNAPDGSAPDPAKWRVISSGSGFGNNELEYYTARPGNIHQENGKLVITARKEKYTGEDGARAYTSARLESQGRFELKYGRVEARIKIARGQGIWPAFWMLGSDFESIGWPACGEVDIMENIGSEPSRVHGSLHGPGYSGSNPLSAFYTLPNHRRFSDGYHVFAIEWEPQTIRFYVDNVLFETQNAGDLAEGKTWAFNHPFFLVLNVAVGGFWPGKPNTTTAFPTSMLVDYVRVYRLEEPAKPLATVAQRAPEK